MFTGIIEAVGTVKTIEPRNGDLRLGIQTGKLDLSDVKIGDSISTSGCCLTVVDLPGDGYAADVSLESLKLTTIGDWQEGTQVNLEKSLTPMTRMGGHMVSGHVDDTAEVLSREASARAEIFWLRAPVRLARYIAHKGSISIDGISLTVNEVKGADFCLTIVPHTLQETVMNNYQVGTRVNLEVDLIARYLERLQLGDAAAEAG
ncbi:MAG: riboflavin synthase [Porticoccaceae bacterium]